MCGGDEFMAPPSAPQKQPKLSYIPKKIPDLTVKDFY
jgi:hypothetical protein